MRLKRVAAGLLLILAVLLVVLLPLPLTVADSGPVITASSAEAEFPLRANFNLSVTGAADIEDVRLHYRVARQSFVDVTSEVAVDFPPGNDFTAEYTLDMRFIGGFPPGTGLSYWWTLADRDGVVVTSEPAAMIFSDDRYTWQTQTQGSVTLHWYEGDDAFAAAILRAADDALNRLTAETGATLQRPVDIYIYDSFQALLGAMVFPQEWTGGAAYSTYDAIVIGIPKDRLEWGISAVSHELAHLVIHQITDNPYLRNPVWLDEGLAISAEPAVREDYLVALQWAQDQDLLFSVRSLCSPFSAVPSLAILGYAQSWSLVQYLTDTYGQDKMLELLAVMSRGSDYDAALLEVYGFDIEGLDTLWREYAEKEYGGNG
jgi:peptidase MA superfamily protein